MMDLRTDLFLCWKYCCCNLICLRLDELIYGWFNNVNGRRVNKQIVQIHFNKTGWYSYTAVGLCVTLADSNTKHILLSTWLGYYLYQDEAT